MNNLEIFNLIKKDAEYFSIEDIIPPKEPSEQEQQQPHNRIKYISRLVTEYNQQTFLEIKSRKCIEMIEEVDAAAFNEFTFRINKYMDENAPGQDALKRYVRLISTYLTFIAKRSLHPPGMIMGGEQKIVGKDNKFYCPVKNKQMHGALSVCKYCVSRDISEINEKLQQKKS
ncbi:MAG TPA: DUF2115 family protein [Negativicutes bacterium]